MPIVNISSLPPPDSKAIPRMIADVQRAGAQALNCELSNIWVMFQPVQPGQYLKDGDPTPPPVVIVKAQSGRTHQQKEAFVGAIAVVIAEGLSVPSKKVWIHYQEMAPQDVWFEGRWAG